MKFFIGIRVCKFEKKIETKVDIVFFVNLLNVSQDVEVRITYYLK